MLTRAKTSCFITLMLLGTACQADISFRRTTVDHSKRGKWEAKVARVRFQGPSKLAKAVNDSLRLASEKRLNAFLKAAREGAGKGPSGASYWFDETPTVNLAKPDLLSVVTEVGSFEGGAHGYSYPVFDNWAIVAGKPVKLRIQDLLIRNRKDVEAVSTLAMGKLAKIERADWVQDGTVRELGPDTENSFTITKKGLRYTFAAYVMGSYASGPIDVELSWAELRGLVNPNGPLKPVLAGRSR